MDLRPHLRFVHSVITTLCDAAQRVCFGYTPLNFLTSHKTGLVRTYEHWPSGQPTALPVGKTHFRAVEQRGELWPALLLSAETIQLWSAAMQQTDEIRRAEQVFGAANEASLAQDDVMVQRAEGIRNEVNDLEESHGNDRGSDNSSWCTADEQARERMGRLWETHAAINIGRLHAERERSVWHYAIVDRYRRLDVLECEAQKELGECLRSEGILKTVGANGLFAKTWTSLPERLRRNPRLHKMLEKYKVVPNGIGAASDFEDRDVEAIFDRDEHDCIQAMLTHEKAQIDLARARKNFDRSQHDVYAMEEGYRTAHLTGRTVPTP